MSYQMAATAVTLNNLEGHSQLAGLYKYNPSNICTSFCTISTKYACGPSALAEFLVSIGRLYTDKIIVYSRNTESG